MQAIKHTILVPAKHKRYLVCKDKRKNIYISVLPANKKASADTFYSTICVFDAKSEAKKALRNILRNEIAQIKAKLRNDKHLSFLEEKIFAQYLVQYQKQLDKLQ